MSHEYEEIIIARLRGMSGKEVLAYIRGVLTTDGIRSGFNMSGYDGTGTKGSCTLGNQAILNRFAHLGLYDYTEFLFLDFYKGTGGIYYKNWGGGSLEVMDYLDGETTAEIIYRILQITVLSDKPTRRRD